jgi:SAM-dependent methyltransferase
MAEDVLGKALLDFHRGELNESIYSYSSLGEEDSFPVSYLFREYRDMPLLEKKALSLCKGKVLDIGCGAGSHSLYLQTMGHRVTALDSSPGAAQVCRERGLEEVVQGDFLSFKGEGYDTLLLLMNGIGLAGKISGLSPFFEKAKELLAPDGQILFDSSDIIYMYDQTEDGGYLIPSGKGYYGEVDFKLRYKTMRGAPFSWLYIDFNTVCRAAQFEGFQSELVRKGKHFDYLAKLTIQA